MAFDFDRDGHLSNTEIMPLARMLQLGNQFYDIHVAEQLVLSLTPAQPAMGQLALQGATSWDLSLWSSAVCGNVVG